MYQHTVTKHSGEEDVETFEKRIALILYIFSR